MSEIRAAVLASVAWLAGGCAAAPPAPAPASPVQVAPKTAARPASRPYPGMGAAAAVVTDCGLRLVINSDEYHYTIDLFGTNVSVHELDGIPAFLVDDLMVQVVDVTPAQIGVTATGKNGMALLRAHEAWESAYIAHRLGVNLQPQDIAVTPANVKARPAALTWWLPMEDGTEWGVTVHHNWSFATVILGERVVGLSAMARGGLEPMDVETRLLTWLGTLRFSPTPISAQAISAQIKAGARTECPEISSRDILGIDRRFRLDGIARKDIQRLVRAAEGSGGVERQTVGDHLRYRNHVCRFEMTYPDAEWKDFEMQDFSERGCSANLATPLLVDKETREKITNAVLLTATKASDDFGAAQLQDGMVDAVKSKGARTEPVKKPLIDGALQVSYASDLDGTHFVGDILTVRRGDMLYNIHFNSTRGTVEEGRKHLAKLLGGLKLDQP